MTFSAITGWELLIAAVFFILGCIMGSFLNVCIWRLPRGLTINEPPRSICPFCKTVISARDNIPLVSYFVLGGKCRRCGAPISPRYLLVEALTAALFAAVYLLQGVAAGQGAGVALVMALTMALLIAASLVDLEFLIIPDEISVFGIAGGLLAGLLMPELHVGSGCAHTFASFIGLRPLDGLIASALGGAIGAGLVLLFATLGAWIFKREAMGFGDVKLMTMIGALMGWKVAVLAFFFAPFFALLYGIPLLLLKGKHIMPFAPFLSLAAVLVILLRSSVCDLLTPAVEMARLLFGG